MSGSTTRQATAPIRLGTGRAGSIGIAPKAAMLDRAAAADLPVPDGFIVPDGLDPADGAAADEHASALTAETTVGGRSARSFAVRSAFGAEDGRSESLAGWFDSELRVPATDVADAVKRVRTSADRRPGRFRTDVLVMAMVEAEHAGVAFSEPDTYDDIVNETTGTAEGLVAGDVEGNRRLLARIERVERGWPTRLRQLLDDVRRVFGDEPWDVEWADDGERCWLIQIRPITVPPRRDEILTLANHAEILPDLPSVFMTSLIEAAGPELFDWYRRHDKSLPSDRHFLQVKAGRPLINLSLLEDMMRHLGLPTGLVADSIGGEAISRRPANPRRLARKTPTLVRLGLAQITATVRTGSNRKRIMASAAEPTEDFAEAIDRMQQAYVALVTGMFPLSSAIGPPMSALRRLGVLGQHAARHRTITTELADAVADLGPNPDDRALTAFLDRFGHRGVYESDIARPRYRNDPTVLQTMALPTVTSGPKPGRRRPPQWSLLGRLTTPLWLAVRGPLNAREQWRHDAMAAFELIRDELLRHARRAVDRGQLPDVEALWDLHIDEVKRFDHGWVADQQFLADRRQDRQQLATIAMPMTVSSGDDPASWSADGGDPNGLRGLPLTSGSVDGVAWVLDEPAAAASRPDTDEPVILVARSIDAGWIATMAGCDGVVVEIGGDLSHGSILVRELGLPAVTNVAGARATFTTGDPIRLDAASGRVEPGTA